MLERYIEKNIFRQVYLCQQLYQKKKIALHTMAERLNVCTITITNDAEIITGRKLQKKNFFPPARSIKFGQIFLNLPRNWAICSQTTRSSCRKRIFVTCF